MSARHFSREFWRSIRRSPLSHMGSLVMSTLLFVLFDLFWIGSRVADNYFEELLGQLQLEVFVDDTVSDTAFQSHLTAMQDIVGITRAQVFTRELARERLAKRLGQDFLSDDETNPLPRSILLSFEKGFASAENFEALALSLAGWRGVFQVSYSRAWLRRTEGQLARIDQALRVVMIAVLGGAMLNAALLAGLIVRAKADDIKQMRLLGAGGVFLGAPHVLQGALLTGLAGALSWGIIMAAQRHFQISEVNAGLPPYENMAALALTAAVVGAFGAALAVRVTIRRSR